MTWKEFKEKVEAEGVQDQDTIAYIDITASDDWSARIRPHIMPGKEWEIW